MRNTETTKSDSMLARTIRSLELDCENTLRAMCMTKDAQHREALANSYASKAVSCARLRAIER